MRAFIARLLQEYCINKYCKSIMNIFYVLRFKYRAVNALIAH